MGDEKGLPAGWSLRCIAISRDDTRWPLRYAFSKLENGSVNTVLGKGIALDIFNSDIMKCKVVPSITKGEQQLSRDLIVSH